MGYSSSSQASGLTVTVMVTETTLLVLMEMHARTTRVLQFGTGQDVSTKTQMATATQTMTGFRARALTHGLPSRPSGQTLTATAITTTTATRLGLPAVNLNGPANILRVPNILTHALRRLHRLPTRRAVRLTVLVPVGQIMTEVRHQVVGCPWDSSPSAWS